VRSDHFKIENLSVRLSKLKKNPWGDMAKTKHSIAAAMLKHVGARLPPLSF
jgi:hypothetical protein